MARHSLYCVVPGLPLQQFPADVHEQAVTPLAIGTPPPWRERPPGRRGGCLLHPFGRGWGRRQCQQGTTLSDQTLRHFRLVHRLVLHSCLLPLQSWQLTNIWAHALTGWASHCSAMPRLGFWHGCDNDGPDSSIAVFHVFIGWVSTVHLSSCPASVPQTAHLPPQILATSFTGEP